jgi:hypothetical protein
MNKTARKGPAFCSGLLMTMVSLGAACLAQSQGQEQLPAGAALASAAETGPAARQAVESMPVWSNWKSQ